MSELYPHDPEASLENIRRLAAREALRVTQHAQQEMAEEDISLDEVLESIRSGQILENYPEHRRGPCCLLLGYTGDRRPVHVVSTTVQPVLILITVYEPKPPKWVTPTQRRFRP